MVSFYLLKLFHIDSVKQVSRKMIMNEQADIMKKLNRRVSTPRSKFNHIQNFLRELDRNVEHWVYHMINEIENIYRPENKKYDYKEGE